MRIFVEHSRNETPYINEYLNIEINNELENNINKLVVLLHLSEKYSGSKVGGNEKISQYSSMCN